MASLLDLRDRKGAPRYWWSQLAAVPGRSSGLAYERLKRVWFDQTGCRDWFRNELAECHLVSTLFENMVLFDPALWIPELLELAGAHAIPSGVTACRWSYEFEDERNLKNGRATIADIVVCARDTAGEFVIVMEAKRVGGGLKAGDSDPDYYLGSLTFHDFDRRYMLYLLDEQDRENTAVPVSHDQLHRGILTWQQLAGLQLALARRLEVPEVLQNFIASAIQYQFCQHDIRPSPLAFGYLAKEAPYEEMPMRKEEAGAQQKRERRDPIWRCDWAD